MSPIEQARQSLLEHIQNSGKTQSSVARELDIAKSTLSLFLNGNYTGDNEAMASRISQYLSRGNLKQSLAKIPGFCPDIDNTDRILDVVNMTHATNDISLIYGPSGCGKTTALKHYSSTHSNVIHIESDVPTNKSGSILPLLLESMGEKPRGSIPKMMRHTISRLQDTDSLIIVDEAQHLTASTFDCLRALNDKAGTAIVFAGNPKILKKMYRQMEEDFDQVFSRIGFHCCLYNRFNIGDISALYQNFNISDECLKLMVHLSHKQGGLRRLVKQCKMATNIATGLNEKLSVYHFEAAAKRMAIDLK